MLMNGHDIHVHAHANQVLESIEKVFTVKAFIAPIYEKHRAFYRTEGISGIVYLLLLIY